MLEYPKFSYAPKNAKARIHDSVVRLDTIQSVYHSHLEPTPTRLSVDALSILRGQIECYLAGRDDTLYHDAREQLLHPDFPPSQA